MRPTIAGVLLATAEEANVPLHHITLDRRLDYVVKLRHVAQYLCRLYVDEHLSVIGREIGERSGSMVTVAYQKISFDKKFYQETRSLIEDIEQNLRDKGFILQEIERLLDNTFFKGENVYTP